jgi:predicted TIM-barrel fold metal-dependent hydrolase
MDAEIMFPGVVHGYATWRNIRDDNVYKACIRAYNDFVAEEYAAFAPDRFFPIGVIPRTNLQDALEELQHCAKLGLKGIVLPAFPSGRGYPSTDDDPFWREALAIRMPVTVHVSMNRGDDPLVKYPKAFAGQDLATRMTKLSRAGGDNVVQFIVGGVFDRFPELRVFFAENQIGWVPTFMSVMDERYVKHLEWAQELLGFQPLQLKPSDYVRRNVLWGFQNDPAGVELRHWMGVENLIWASDFPHQESDYPHSLASAENNFKSVSKEERRKMVCDNAATFFHLN